LGQKLLREKLLLREATGLTETLSLLVIIGIHVILKGGASQALSKTGRAITSTGINSRGSHVLLGHLGGAIRDRHILHVIHAYLSLIGDGLVTVPILYEI
jgi:hypothetical protein